MKKFVMERVPNESPELFNNIIETLPVPPIQSALFFGISGLSSLEKGGYYQACIDRRVIPRSNFQLYYGQESRCLARQPDFEFGGAEAMEGLIGGGRFSKVSVIIEDPDGAAFQAFRECKFPVLLRSGYELRNANLWFSSRYLGDEGGHVKTSGLSLATRRTSIFPGVELLLPADVGVPVADRTKLLEWWEELKTFPNPQPPP